MAPAGPVASLCVDPAEVTMSKPILVAYATKHESTHEVAETLAACMRERGVEVDVRPAAEVGMLKPYGAVVLGGALYMGRWHRDARRFLAHHRDDLAHLPIAVFAMGPLEMTPTDVDGSRRQLDRALAKERDLAPVAVTIFGGVVDPAKLHFPFTHMDATDARDWQAIRAWADELGDLFGTPAAA
jgi:menaquinone-dependent protoporphyrinogen oxidase